MNPVDSGLDLLLSFYDDTILKNMVKSGKNALRHDSYIEKHRCHTCGSVKKCNEIQPKLWICELCLALIWIGVLTKRLENYEKS